MKQIDHEPNERRPGWTIWWVAWGIVAVMWAATAYLDGFIWDQIGLGFVTGVLLCAWALTITDDKPSSLLRRRRD